MALIRGSLLDYEGLGDCSAGGGQAHDVAGGGGPDAGGAAEGAWGEAFGGGVVEVPDETVEAGGGGGGRRRRGPVRRDGLARGVGRAGLVVGGVAADGLALAVQDLDCDGSRRGGLQVVVEDRAVWGVLASGLVLRKGSSLEAGGVEADRLARGEEPGVRRGDGRGQLAQGRDVVEDPEGAAVGRDDEVAVADGDVAHGAVGEVAGERLPVVAVVEGDEDAGLGSGEEEAALLGVLADRR